MRAGDIVRKLIEKTMYESLGSYFGNAHDHIQRRAAEGRAPERQAMPGYWVRTLPEEDRRELAKLTAADLQDWFDSSLKLVIENKWRKR